MLRPESVPCPHLLDEFHDALTTNRSGMLRAVTHRPDPLTAFARSVAHGLSQRPRRMECRFLYDAKGSELYEQICQQPEYYPTRTEATILARYAETIRDLTGPVTLLELGAGNAVKTHYLLETYSQKGSPARYVPIDVSGSALREAENSIAGAHPEVQVIGIHGTYQDAIPLFDTVSPAMVLFLGSTMGNFSDREMTSFWQWMADHIKPGDFFLLGLDLIKEVGLLEAAYNDKAGVTAHFTKNFFARMNRELGCDIDIPALEHVARYEASRERMEIYIRAGREQDVYIQPLDQHFTIAAGEEILIEVSRKFRLENIVPFLEKFGFATRRVFTDDRNWFGLLLLQKNRS